MRTPKILLAAIMAISLFGCGEDDGVTAEQQANAATDIKKNLATALNALLSGDATTAFDYFSDRCQEALPLEGVQQVTETIAERNLPAAEILSLSAELTSPTRAIVTYEASVAGLSQDNEVWVFERNDWRTDGCESLT